MAVNANADMNMNTNVNGSTNETYQHASGYENTYKDSHQPKHTTYSYADSDKQTGMSK